MGNNNKCQTSNNNNNNFLNNNNNNNHNISNNSNKITMITKDTQVSETQDLISIVCTQTKTKKRKNTKKKNFMKDKLPIGKKKEIKHLKIKIMIQQ